jgi:hypothetical protein
VFRYLVALAIFLACFASTAPAQNAAEPIRPKPRPATLLPVVPSPAPQMQAVSPASAGYIRPRPRPVGIVPVPDLTSRIALGATVRPLPRPAGLRLEPPKSGGLFGGLLAAKPAQPKKPAAPRGGYVCGDPDIKGASIAAIPPKVKGCGLAQPVRVTEVDGIRLSTPATIDCDTAKALKTWINKGLRPAFGRRDVVELRIAASYTCRPRNNVRGAKVSEHGRGRAIDIAGFVFSDGREMSVRSDYGRDIRKAHKAACGIFGTTLGPGSDGFHEDHLHFDTARYRNGPYCR